MVASSASASSERHLLVISPGWIGDAIMSMPALQQFQAAYPATVMTILAKPNLLPLWGMYSPPHRQLAITGNWQTTAAIMHGHFAGVFIFPNSVRSALLPWLAAVPERVGLSGHWRRWLLTKVAAAPVEATHHHQVWEYAAILGVEALQRPPLEMPVTARRQAEQRVAGLARPLIGVLPGAARGPAKRWPAEHFAAAAQALQIQTGGSVLVMGGTGDAESCAEVARGAGKDVLNMAGATSLTEWAALLALCAVVLCNDSGGMHLAAAVGAPVVAVFGLTDPARTGPRSARSRVLQHSCDQDRAVPRDSRRAIAALQAVTTAEVLEAALELLQERPRHA